MTNRSLAMPEYVAKLISVQLTLIGLQPTMQDDITVCPLMYEDGSALSLITMCIDQYACRDHQASGPKIE